MEGRCTGRRQVAMQLLDVAGLMKGASEGRGLGNKFLDDLRLADLLVHVVDVSGTTDEEGKKTRGYDPSEKVTWLREEIFLWIKGNLCRKWDGVKRRHISTKASNAESIQIQFSGYGATKEVVAGLLERLQLTSPLQTWGDMELDRLVNAFVDNKFPTVIALNKIDHPDADQHIARMSRKLDAGRLILMSALWETYLQRLDTDGFIRYQRGSDQVETSADDASLQPLDEKESARVEEMKDMLLFRFGSTGVDGIMDKAVEMLQLIPVFPVKSINSPVIQDCLLIKRGTTVAGVARKLFGEIKVWYVEGVRGRVSMEDDIVPNLTDVLSFHFKDASIA